jgi:hypothetical protein
MVLNDVGTGLKGTPRHTTVRVPQREVVHRHGAKVLAHHEHLHARESQHQRALAFDVVTGKRSYPLAPLSLSLYILSPRRI